MKKVHVYSAWCSNNRVTHKILAFYPKNIFILLGYHKAGSVAKTNLRRTAFLYIVSSS